MKDNFIPPDHLTTPVLFMIFNRPDTTQKVFNAIKKAKPRKLFVAADGPREGKEGEKEICGQARKIMEQVNWNCELKTLFRDKNLGCKIAVSSAIDWFFENVEEGIILEDDCLPSQSFFWFCQELLERYKNDMRVYHITGRNNLGSYLPSLYDYHFATGGSIWGWATWRNRWGYNNLNLDIIEDKEASKKLKDFLCNTNAFRGHLNAMRTIKEDKVNTWDYYWIFSTKINNGLSIVPSKNLVKNIGFGEDATHTTVCTNIEQLNMIANEIEFPIKHPSTISVDRKLSNLLDNIEFPLESKLKLFIKKFPVLYRLARIIKGKLL
jgi:hypothetical protein